MREVSAKSTGIGRLLLVLIFRLLLLTVGGGIAALVGVAIAFRYPNPTPKEPLAAQLLQSWEQNINPKKNSSQTATPTALPVTESPTPISQPTPLTSAQRKKLETELKQLQTQLNNARRKGNRNAIAPLEKQIQTLEQQLKGTPQPSPNNQTEVQTLPASTPFFSADSPKVSIPSDALFEDRQAILRPESAAILFKIASELKNYPGTTILIAAHTDGVGEAKENRTISFRQAQAVEQYLSSLLGKQYHWLVVGYGETKPLVPNDTATDLQRNRRMEIAIVDISP